MPKPEPVHEGIVDLFRQRPQLLRELVPNIPGLHGAPKLDSPVFSELSPAVYQPGSGLASARCRVTRENPIVHHRGKLDPSSFPRRFVRTLAPFAARTAPRAERARRDSPHANRRQRGQNHVASNTL